MEESPEILRLTEARDQLRWIRKTYQGSDLKREIKLLQEVSRFQPLQNEVRILLLKELEKRKIALDIIEDKVELE